MQIVIDISENDYETIKDVYPVTGFIGYAGVKSAYKAILDGTVLPEKHGRLIDADALIAGGCYWETEEEVSNAPTILEAEGK